MSQSRPRLIIGGASKSGTTAVYYYLRQHPGICLSRKKELHFFSRSSLERTVSGPGDRFVLAEIPKTFNEYLSFFRHCDGSKMAVDISPSYLFHHEAAEVIKHFLSDVRIVFILRNPVEKGFSQYLHLVAAGRETVSFEEALERESKRKAQGFADMWLYRASGYYSVALEHFMQVFGRKNMKIFYYEEFLHDPERVLLDICAFAHVDSAFQFEPVTDANRSGQPKSALVTKILGPSTITFFARRILPQAFGRSLRKFVKEWNTGSKPILSENTRKVLLEGYRDDIRRIEALIGRESGWVK